MCAQQSRPLIYGRRADSVDGRRTNARRACGRAAVLARSRRGRTVRRQCRTYEIIVIIIKNRASAATTVYYYYYITPYTQPTAAAAADDDDDDELVEYYENNYYNSRCRLSTSVCLSVAGPTVWNSSLPDEVGNSDSFLENNPFLPPLLLV